MIPSSYKWYFFYILLSSSFFFLHAYLKLNISIYTFLICFFIINIYYTFAEYIIHRYFFHDILKNIHKKHHDEPKQYYRLFIPIKITLINEFILACTSYLLSYYFCGNEIAVYPILLSARLSYLLFEFSHYVSHYYSYYSKNFISYFIPKRLVSFHQFHHIDDNYHFGFTTPFWDILFNTCKNRFDITEYPLCFLPISIISFINVEQLVTLSNIFYLYPSFVCHQLNWTSLSLFYFLTGLVSGTYHSVYHHSIRFYLKVIDYTFAISYLFISVYLFVNQNLMSHIESYIWFTISMTIYLVDNSEFTHFIWHIFTACGVGRMLDTLVK